MAVWLSAEKSFIVKPEQMFAEAVDRDEEVR